jgi:hypothetical protein
LPTKKAAATPKIGEARGRGGERSGGRKISSPPLLQQPRQAELSLKTQKNRARMSTV